MIETLQWYEKASGQNINFQKSAVTFSPNVERELQDNLLGILGLNVTHSHDRYLGLPWKK